jgi:hypothetical protein
MMASFLGYPELTAVRVQTAAALGEKFLKSLQLVFVRP